MSKTRHFHMVGLLLLLTASVSVSWVAAQDAGKKMLPASMPASSSRYVDLGEGWHPRFLRAADPDSPVATVARELHHVILPKVELNDVLFSDAITYFQQSFRDHNPEHLGMSFFIKRPLPSGPVTHAGPPPPVSPHPSEIRVTLNMRKVRYSEALDKLAAAAGMQWKIEPYAIAFVPLSESAEPLFTVERVMSPEVVGFATDTKGWLESKGVDFPPGASARYLSDSHKLVVRQTRANLDEIRLIVNSQDQPASPIQTLP